jgi:hypothetical protein
VIKLCTAAKALEQSPLTTCSTNVVSIVAWPDPLMPW